MYQIHRDQLTVEHTIARSIYGPSGELLLARGAQLNPEVLRILPITGQEVFWVKDDSYVEIQFDPLIREQIAMQTAHEIVQSADKFREAFDLNCKSLQEIQKNFDQLHRFSALVDHEVIKKNAVKLVQEVMQSPALLLNR